MTFAVSTRSAVRSLINDFGNAISVYDFSAATKATNSEGEVSVSDWKTATAAFCIDGANESLQNIMIEFGRERIGEDEIIIRDDVSVDEKDRITRNSKEFAVVSISPVRAQSTTIVQIVRIERRDNTTNWY